MPFQGFIHHLSLNLRRIQGSRKRLSERLGFGRGRHLNGIMSMQYKIPLVMTPQPEGGYTVTSPLLPELVTEGDTVEEALANVRDALAAVIEAYEDLGRRLPQNTMIPDTGSPVWLETLVTAP